MGAFSIDTHFLGVKLIYFTYLAGISCFLPYAVLYSYHLGLTPSQVGLIWGLQPLVSSLCPPLWGSVADKYSKHKQIFMAFLVFTSGLYLSMLFIPPVNNVSSTADSNTTVVENCAMMLDYDLECPVSKTILERTSFGVDDDDDDLCFSVCSSYGVNQTSLVCDQKSNILYCDICQDKDDRALKNYSEVASNDSVLVSPSYSLMCDSQIIITSNNSCDSLKCCNCPEILSADDDTDSGDLMLTFGLTLFLVLFSTIFTSVQMPMIDAVCFGILAERGGNYGKQRLWGSIGWGIFAFVSGIAVDKYNEKLNSDRIHYDPIFYMYVGFTALTFLCATFMRFPPHKPAKRVGNSIWLVLKKAYVIAYFGVVVIIGIGFGMQGAYLFMFMSELESSYLVMGLSQVIMTMSEIPCFFVSGPIIKRLGHNGTFCLALLMYSVRFLGYSFAPNPWVILPFQVLHGITFGLFWAAATSYAAIIAPEGLTATLQTICAALHFGVGRAVGISLGGVIFEEFGSRNLFRICSGLCIASCVVYYLILCCLGITLREKPPDHEEKQEKTDKDDGEADVPLQEVTGTKEDHTLPEIV